MFSYNSGRIFAFCAKLIEEKDGLIYNNENRQLLTLRFVSCFEGGGVDMCHIVICADDPDLGRSLSAWTRSFCAQNGLFPIVGLYENSSDFNNAVKKSQPSVAVVALPGVAGLNAAEHLRSLCPDCGLIWCSDLDFSLHAYRLRANYFIKAPPTDAQLCEGLSVWLNRRSLKNLRVK